MGHTKTHRSAPLILSLFTALALTMVGVAAQAQGFGVEADSGIPVGDTSDALDLGYGFQGRTGYGLPLPMVDIQFEAGLDYFSFALDEFDDGSTTTLRYFGGIRLGVPIPYVPSLYFHGGFATGTTTINDAEVGTSEGFTWDAGVAVDVFSVPFVAVGLHLAYKVISPSEETDANVSWLGLGIHADLSI